MEKTKIKGFLCCGILEKEISEILSLLPKPYSESIVTYMDPLLHVDFDKLSVALTQKCSEMKQICSELTLVYGSKCLPDIVQLAKTWDANIMEPPDCIGLLAGPLRDSLDSECKTFYLSPGWLEHWERIFKIGLGWDSIDARQILGGFYDRILFLDTGVAPFSDEQILEFYDYCQVPVEFLSVKLDDLKNSLLCTQCQQPSL